MTLVLAYGALLVALACLTLMRRGTTLVRGEGLLTFQLVVAAAALAAGLLGVVRSDPLALGVFPLLVGAALPGLRTWWLVHFDPEATRLLVQESLERVLARYEPIPDGFEMASRAGPIRIRLQRVAPGLGRLRIEAPVRTPKLALLRELVAKGMHPALPRLRIRLK